MNGEKPLVEGNSGSEKITKGKIFIIGRGGERAESIENEEIFTKEEEVKSQNAYSVS